MNWIKLALATVIFPPLLGAFYFFYISYQSGVKYNQSVLVIFIVFAYWLAILVGVPLVMMLKKKGIDSLKRHLLFGWLGTVSSFFLLCFISSLVPPISEFVIFSVFGVFSGFVSWYVVKK